MDQATTFLAQIQALRTVSLRHDDQSSLLSMSIHELSNEVGTMCGHLPVGTVLPRGYVACRRNGKAEEETFPTLASPEAPDRPLAQAHYSAWIRFGEDIAAGLIGEIATFLATQLDQMIAVDQVMADAQEAFGACNQTDVDDSITTLRKCLEENPSEIPTNEALILAKRLDHQELTVLLARYETREREKRALHSAYKAP